MFNCTNAGSLLLRSDSLSKPRLYSMLSVTAASTVSVYTVLGRQWYEGYERVPFRWFNDGDEWLQIDKFGHGLSAYYGGYFGYNALKWTGLNDSYCLWGGGLYGFGFLLGTELMDGYSSGWGASPGDLLANGVGSSLFIAQHIIFKKQIFVPKFSYWPTNFAQYRPELLGDSHWNRWLKDYNGQNYWLSFALSDLGVKKNVPKWLALSLGIGANGMLGGKSNPLLNDAGLPLPFYDRSREFYMSLDVNLDKIGTKSALLKTILKGISFVKIPFPGFIYSDGVVKGRWLVY